MWEEAPNIGCTSSSPLVKKSSICQYFVEQHDQKIDAYQRKLGLKILEFEIEIHIWKSHTSFEPNKQQDMKIL